MPKVRQRGWGDIEEVLGCGFVQVACASSIMNRGLFFHTFELNGFQEVRKGKEGVRGRLLVL